MNEIGWAVKQLQDGLRVQRHGWNGKGMWIAIQLPRPGDGDEMTLPYVYMKTTTNDLVPWLCSQSDLLATDWEITE